MLTIQRLFSVILVAASAALSLYAKGESDMATLTVLGRKSFGFTKMDAGAIRGIKKSAFRVVGTVNAGIMLYYPRSQPEGEAKEVT